MNCLSVRKTLDLFSNNPENLRPVYEWQSQDHINFRISREGGRLFIHLLTQQFGDFNLSIRIPVNQPSLFGPDSHGSESFKYLTEELRATKR